MSRKPASPLVLAAMMFGLVLAGVLAWFTLTPRESATEPPSETTSTESGTKRSAPTPSPVPLARASASGRVQSTAKTPLERARVTLLPIEGSVARGSDPIDVDCAPDGSWSIEDLEPGRYALSATAKDHLPGLRPLLRVAAGGEHSGLDFALEPGGSPLSGVVRDLTGGEIEGVRLKLTPVGGASSLRERESFFALTDGEGRYSVAVPLGRFRVQASHPDYTSEQAVLDLGKGPRTQDFQLVPMAIIEGVVLRADDRSPVEGASVAWSREVSRLLPGGERATLLEKGGTTLTDAEGRFRIRGLLPGTALVGARAPGLASDAPLAVPVAIAERIEGIEILVGRAADLHGRVVAADDPEQGIAGARIDLGSPGGPVGRATSDAEGRFVVHGIAPGRYEVFAEAEGWLPTVPAPRVEVELDSEEEVRVSLARGLAIRGRVEPPASAEISIEVQPEKMEFGGGGMGVMMLSSAATAVSAETGEFELAPVQPGTYSLVAKAADGRGGRVEVEVGETGAEGVVIPLEPRAKLAGIVRDAKGAVVPGAKVIAHRVDPARADVRMIVDGRELTGAQAPTSDEGRYELLGLDAGEWSIEVSDGQGDALAWADGSRNPLRVVLADAEVREGFDLAVETRDGVIDGVLEDAQGNPVADAWVSVAYVAMAPEPEPPAQGEEHSEMRMVMATDEGLGANAALPPTITDQEGKFRFEGLRRGPHLLSAESVGADGGVAKATKADVIPNAKVRLELAPLGRIEGKVTGDPDEDCIARPCIAQLRGPSQRRTKVAEGRFDADRLEPGIYTVLIETKHGGAQVEVEVEAGETADVEIPMQRFARAKGRIVDAQGEPLVGVEIMIGTSSEEGRVEISREGDEEAIVTDQEGRFDVAVAPGPRVIIAIDLANPRPLAMRRFTVESGKDVDLGDLGPMKEGPPGP